METKDINKRAFLRELKRVQSNAIYFLDEYWNKMHPDQKLTLTDDEKQQIFDNNKCWIPHFPDPHAFHKHMEAYDAAKAQGLKDWEIY